MHPELHAKHDHLREILAATGGCAVAFSGGVDSSLLLVTAREVLGDRCLAVIADSSTYPRREHAQALSFVRSRNIPYVVVNSEELEIPGFSANPADRCYWCKKELFTKVREQAALHGLPSIAVGANADDVGDYRPGMTAACDMGVLSPLLEAGLTKADIRAIAREVYNLDIADKPASACLASRFPYGNDITRDKLAAVEAVEDFLFAKGFRVVRARHHGDILRLELGPNEMAMALREDQRGEIAAFIRGQGFVYAALDLEGYRTGSMNETLER